MKMRQTGQRRKGTLHMTARLAFAAECADEMTYLSWLADMVRSGHAHRIYCEEKAAEPDVLKGLTEEDLRQARHLFAAVCENVPVDFSYEEMEALQAKGFVYDLHRLPGRGRYAGRFEFMPTDHLEIIVRAQAALGLK